MDQDLNTGSAPKKKLSRRSFLASCIALFAGIAVFATWRFDGVKAIRNFFGFTEEEDAAIRKELVTLREKRPVRLIASLIYFFLIDLGARAVIPGTFESKIIKYWGWRMLRLRSVSWPYVDYPGLGDERFCDGLIRPRL